MLAATNSAENASLNDSLSGVMHDYPEFIKTQSQKGLERCSHIFKYIV